jgi:hypothetical protein
MEQDEMLYTNPSVADVTNAWRTLVLENVRYPRLAQLMARTKLDVTREGETLLLRMYVSSKEQKRWLENSRIAGFEKTLSGSLSPASVRIGVEVNPKKADWTGANREFIALVSDKISASL